MFQTIQLKQIHQRSQNYSSETNLITSDLYTEKNVGSNKKDPKFKVGDQVKISKYKNFFAKVYTAKQSEEVFVIIKNKNTVPWTSVITALNGKEIIGKFYEKELQKTNQKEFRICFEGQIVKNQKLKTLGVVNQWEKTITHLDHI